MVKTKDLVYNLLILSVIASAFFTCISALTHISYASGTTTNTVVASVNVLVACYITPNSPSVSFGGSSGLAPGGTSTYNSILYSDTAGNINAYIFVAATNWIYSSNSAFGFGSSNTVWSATGSGSGTAMVLYPSTANTAILISAGGTNTAYFAVNIPNAQPANAYTQNIIGQVSC